MRRRFTVAAMLSVACVLGVAVVAGASGTQDAAQPPSLKAGRPAPSRSSARSTNGSS